MFWNKFEELCNRNNISPRNAARVLQISQATITKWKSGSFPNSTELICRMATYFRVTVDYLMTDTEININLTEKKKSGQFQTLLSLPERWYSLHRCDTPDKEQLLRIARYVNCPVNFLVNRRIQQYEPPGAYPIEQLFEMETLHDILDILDSCADTHEVQDLQIQLSRIVLYHLNLHKTMEYGLNYSDLSLLRETTGFSYQYMFTGISENPYEILKRGGKLL